ncbi:MAG TPA: adenosine deaminase [Candidatus Angelobacter sp.]|nr:adenosine deaminase [Candidatus Angelobacter sp.]
MSEFRGLKCACRVVLLFLLVTSSAWPQKAASPEQKTARYFESVRNQPSLLTDFLKQMPKGGDLHNHLSGAIYAESFVKWAVEGGLCIDRTTSSFVPPPCDAKDRPPASTAYQDQGLYNQLLDAFSMRGWFPARESGHDHFFATFGKFGAAGNGRTADMLTEVRSRAAADHLQYLELMFTPDGGAAAGLGRKLGWNEDFGKMRDQLLAGGLEDILRQISKDLDQLEATENERMHCGEPEADPGCAVDARYLYQVLRGIPKESVFAQMLTGFEIASRDPRVVGLNMVMAEDWYVPIHDFNLHMKMMDFLHKLYPKVHITLHAGELTPTLVPPEEMFHIRASIEKGHAERIGHGVDVMDEPNPVGLLKDMARGKVLVEVCLTSNDVILGVSGARHPLPAYLKFRVPVALATDDAGVSRSSMTQEYQRAVETYHLKYADLKKMARASIAYSFLPADEKAKAQSQLNSAFAKFERQF